MLTIIVITHKNRFTEREWVTQNSFLLTAHHKLTNNQADRELVRMLDINWAAFPFPMDF